jgi:hypothetical protein
MIPTNKQIEILKKLKRLLMERKNELWEEYYKYDKDSTEAIRVEEYKNGVMEASDTIDDIIGGKYDF